MFDELNDAIPPEALLDERAAAKVLGISPRVLWGLADAGEIPFIKIGPRLKRYDPQDLRDFIERSRRTNQPTGETANLRKPVGGTQAQGGVAWQR
jgi:hypothetical protein